MSSIYLILSYFGAFQSGSATHPIRTMASRSMSAVLVLGFLVVAAFCLAEASAMIKPMEDDLLEAKVKITLHNKSGNDMRLKLGLAGKLMNCKKGKHEVLGPLKVKLEELNQLKLELFVLGKHSKLLNVKALVNLDLYLLGELVKGVMELAFDVVEEGLECKVIKLLCDTEVLARVIVKV